MERSFFAVWTLWTPISSRGWPGCSTSLKAATPQVISVTATPLYLMVQAGMFLDRLYYRLNVVHFEVISE